MQYLLDLLLAKTAAQAGRISIFESYLAIKTCLGLILFYQTDMLHFAFCFIMNWYIKCLRQYADFSGRARRKEYWMFTLFNAIFALVLRFLDDLFGTVSSDLGIGLLVGIYMLAVAIPGLAVSVRRLHDIGKSGWNYLISLIPIVGPILLLVWYCTEGERDSNGWGEDPKMGEA